MAQELNNGKAHGAEAVIKSRVAAIDIGSNAIRMQVFERDDKGEIRIVSTLRKPIRLGQDVFHNGRILPESFNAALESMEEFRRVIGENGVSQWAAVATSAVREASNGPEFVHRVLEETGIDIQIIGGSEEARLVITAILDRMSLKGQTALHIEVGGGSAEVSIIEDAAIIFSLTHKLGAVRLMQVLNKYSDTEDRFRDMVKEYIRVTQKRISKNIGDKKIDRFIATGGNIDSMVWLLTQTGWGKVETENGIIKIAFGTLVDTVRRLSMYSFRERVEVLHIRPDRADVILPAGLVYASFADMAKAEWIYAPGVGVRDGLAIELFRREETPHRNEKHKQLISSVNALGERYEFDKLHAEIVTAYSLELFDQLKKVHGLGERERLLLEIAAILHDIGYFIGLSRHHKHSYYIISESDIAGLSGLDQLLVANIARYHRKALPKEQHDNYRMLPQKEKDVILKLAAILRVADSLDREHSGEKMPLTVKLTKNKLQIGLPPSRDRNLMGWAIATKGEMFTHVFGLAVELV